MSNSTELGLVIIEIDTTQGSRYVFPDMPWDVLSVLVQNDTLLGFSQLSLVNQSGAALVIPTRIIRTIRVNGEVKWVSSV